MECKNFSNISSCRVHEFTKVEMFLVTTPESSDEALEDLRIQQEKHFESLGLHFQVLDMPAHELGAQAYRCECNSCFYFSIILLL